jgi:hypothetical protein
MGARQPVEGIARPVRQHVAPAPAQHQRRDGRVPQDRDRAGHPSDCPQMLRRYGASARSARARRTYDRIMAADP